MSISHNPPKSSNSLSNLSFSSATLFSFLSFSSIPCFSFIVFFSRITFLFLKYKAFCLLFDFLAKSRALSNFSFDNLSLHSLVLFLTYIMFPSYARSRAFGFNFIRRSNIPKSLSGSIFVVATLLVSSLSCMSSVPYFPFSVWSKSILSVTTSKPPKIISRHCFVISSISWEQGSISFTKVSSLLIKEGSQKDSPPRNPLQSSLHSLKNLVRF